MCGIAGIINLHDPDRPVEQQQVENMLKAIQHRGPDESGIYLGKNIGLGNVRLSIIDLSSGSQPISAQNGRYWIVYNGEVFNYPEIRNELIHRGYQFKTLSDTEVVLQAYICWGTQCLNRFNGQFAFSIWDNQKKELFLARDRAGIRPLFYTECNGTFYYCSEIKGIFENPEIERRLSADRLAQIFTYWTTLTPQTPYENIKELPPGHFMLISQEKKLIEQYWELSFPTVRPQGPERSIDEYIEEFRALFRDAVKIRLRADVEVAAYLSGGIDSAVTTAFIHDIEPDVLNTFSIGFDEKAFDESDYQKEASQYFNTHHTAFVCTAQEIGENFLNTIYHAEYPILRTAPTPMYLLSKKVRERNIKVVVTGEGADEILAGYNIFKEAKIRRFWATNPKSEIRPLLLKQLYPYLPMMKDAKISALRMFFGYGLNETGNPYYSHLLRWHNTSRINNYLTDDSKAGLQPKDMNQLLDKMVPNDFSNYSDLAKSQYLEFTIFMSNYLLSSQGDRMAMGNSVEGRYPFLDYRVVEFASRLPDRFKLNGLNEKFILKKMMKNKIPDSILNRKKQAYRAPVAESLIGEKSPEFAKELLSDRSISSFGYFNNSMVRKLLEKISSGVIISETDHMALAGILSTQLIHHLFIQGNRDEIKKNDLHHLKVIKQQ